jgi:hypothetical protein
MSEEPLSRNRGQTKARWPDAFDIVKELGCSLPNVEATKKYDGSPVLRVHGVFMAGLAMHASAEPDTLVVRVEFEEREGLLEDAPKTYYVTDYYRRYPVVLVRLSFLKREVLRELLAGSWRMAAAKGRTGRKTPTKMSTTTQF